MGLSLKKIMHALSVALKRNDFTSHGSHNQGFIKLKKFKTFVNYLGLPLLPDACPAPDTSPSTGLSGPSSGCDSVLFVASASILKIFCHYSRPTLCRTETCATTLQVLYPETIGGENQITICALRQSRYTSEREIVGL